jgi:hypothetical protein
VLVLKQKVHAQPVVTLDWFGLPEQALTWVHVWPVSELELFVLPALLRMTWVRQPLAKLRAALW